MPSIECWTTAPDGSGKVVLDRSEASPFRRFAVSRLPGADPGAGSFEYHIDNQLLRDNPALVDDNRLVWMRYRGRTLTWIIEDHQTVLDEQEHSTDWVKVSGRGVKQLLGDRLVWPEKFSESDLDPSQWDFGHWYALLDASAASGQKVVPVDLTAGAVLGEPVLITGGGNRQLGIIDSIIANVSVTLVDNLDFTFPAGSRIISAVQQWRRFINRACGEMLWDLIDESNPRFVADGGPAITRGTIQTNGDDGWTQDFRFDNMLDVVTDVASAFGDVDMEGLEFSYFSDPGSDLRDTVIFEEGADILKVERQSSVRDKLTWVVAEGMGEGITAKLRFSKNLSDPRRREGYLEAKDAANVPLLQQRATAARLEHQGIDSIAVRVTEERFRVFEDYDIHDTIRSIAPSRDVDESLRVVAIYLAETDDEDPAVTVEIDVNTVRPDRLTDVDARGKSAARSIGVRNRQPQGSLVPFSFSGADVFDSTDTMDVFVFVPDRMYLCIEAKALIRFREFFAAAKSAASSGSLTSDNGGGQTTSSGGSSSPTSSSNTPTTIDDNGWVIGTSGSASVGTPHTHAPGGFALLNPVVASINAHSHTVTIGSHSHTVVDHQHSVAGHSHSLVYGVFKETYPGSHSVDLKVYELVAGAWSLRGTIADLTADIEDVDLTAYIDGPGNWRLELKSDAAQPNGGRLGCDVSGYVLGVIQSA